MNPSDVYLDQVQAAVEKHPTWEVEDILYIVFKRWTGQEPDLFIDAIKFDMRKAEDAPPRLPMELR